MVLIFSVHFLWSWLKRLSALKEAVSFLFFFFFLNSWSNKRLFFPGSARPLWGGGFGAEFTPGHREYKEASGSGQIGVYPPHPPSPSLSRHHLFPCPGIWHCAHKQDSQDKQQAKLFVKPLWCILMREKQKCHLDGRSKEEVALMCLPLPLSWAPWEIWSLPQCFLHFQKTDYFFSTKDEKIIIFFFCPGRHLQLSIKMLLL